MAKSNDMGIFSFAPLYDMGMFKFVPLPHDQTIIATVYKTMRAHPEALIDDTMLKRCILTDTGTSPDDINYDTICFGSKSALAQFGIHNDETIDRYRRMVLADYSGLFPGYEPEKSQRSKNVKNFEQKDCMEEIPEFMFRPMKSYSDYPISAVENMMRALGNINKY